MERAITFLRFFFCFVLVYTKQNYFYIQNNNWIGCYCYMCIVRCKYKYGVRVYSEKLMHYVRWSRFSFACCVDYTEVDTIEIPIQRWRIYYLLWSIEIVHQASSFLIYNVHAWSYKFSEPKGFCCLLQKLPFHFSLIILNRWCFVSLTKQ